ncbi:hypothetical protein SU32_06200 [Ahrensia marina]|uniref:Uncharacterized protein n=1 Tax=Ahrensia marina TaxID=1514904 RepID=A0A0N0E855_9HYPH|nr:hypothetical protein SU32_06200 [Ahrensia marina]
MFAIVASNCRSLERINLSQLANLYETNVAQKNSMATNGRQVEAAIIPMFLYVNGFCTLKYHAATIVH